MTQEPDRQTFRAELSWPAVGLVLAIALVPAGWAQTGGISNELYPTFGGGGGAIIPAGESALLDFRRIDYIEETLRERLKSARYRWGAALVTPVYGLPTAAVDANCRAAVLGSEPGDDLQSGCEPRLVARVGVGLFLDFPLTENWILELGGGPSYTWWQNDDSRSGIRSNYSASMHGLFNRFSLSLVASTGEREDVASPEFVNTTILRTDSLRFDTMVQLSERVDWWVGLESSQFNYDNGIQDDQADLVSQLDRDSAVIRTGVRLHGATTTIGVLTSLRKDKFPDEIEETSRDNTRGTLAFELETGWRHLKLDALVGVTSIEADTGASLGDPNEVVGWVDLGWYRRRWSTGVYGGRGVNYSVTSGSQLFVENRLGAFVGVNAKWDLSFRAFVEDRSIDYLNFQDPEIEDPKTETTVLGLTVQLPDVRGLGTSLSIINDDTTSTLTGLDRKVTYVTGSVRLRFQ